MYWIAAFISAGTIGISGMFYLKYYLKQKQAEIQEWEKKLAIPASAIFFLLTSVLMAAFTSPQDSTVFVFLRDIILTHFLFYIAIIDYKLKLIPNKTLLVLLAICVIITVLQLISGENAINLLSDCVLGGIIAGGIFFIGNLISRNGMGMGDVKLMAAAGLMIGMNKIMGLIFWSLFTSLIAGLILIAAKKAKIKTAIPLAPFFLAGSVISNTLYIISGISEV